MNDNQIKAAWITTVGVIIAALIGAIAAYITQQSKLSQQEKPASSMTGNNSGSSTPSTATSSNAPNTSGISSGNRNALALEEEKDTVPPELTSFIPKLVRTANIPVRLPSSVESFHPSGETLYIKDVDLTRDENFDEIPGSYEISFSNTNRRFNYDLIGSISGWPDSPQGRRYFNDVFPDNNDIRKINLAKGIIGYYGASSPGSRLFKLGWAQENAYYLIEGSADIIPTANSMILNKSVKVRH